MLIHQQSTDIFYTFAFRKLSNRMKRIVISILICGVALLCNAQRVKVKNFELEPFIGATVATSDLPNYNNEIGPALGFEFRWNLKELPLDIGAQLYIGSAVYNGKNIGYDDDLSCRTFASTAFIDYNFKKGTKISPFIGLGLSANTYNIVEGDYDYSNSDDNNGIGICPRVGIVFLNHLRATLTGHFGSKIYNTVGFTIGYSFGAGKKISQNKY